MRRENDEGEVTNDELPESWTTFSFTAVFDIQGGTQPPKSTFVYEPADGYVQLLQIRDFGARPVPTFIRDAKGLKKCKKEDVLIARYGASLGRILTGLEGAYNVAMAKVVIPPEIDRRFTFYLLNSEAFQNPLMLVSRSAQNGFNKEDLAKFQLPLAPLAEQKRIADKLEAVLGRVDACRARLDRVPALLKRFRQSVLAAATSGKLTEEWRITRGLGDEWEAVTLGSLMDSKPRNGYSPKSVDFETPVRSLTLTATTSGKFRGEHSKFINEKIPPSSHLWLVPGDILIQRANTIEYVGVSAIFDGPPGKFICLFRKICGSKHCLATAKRQPPLESCPQQADSRMGT